MQKENDTLLVAKLREGNKFAFEALYEKYSARLYNTIVLLVYDKSLAKDITQSSFMTIWEKRSNLDTEKSFPAYLCTIARNMVYKETERRLLHNKFVETSWKQKQRLSRKIRWIWTSPSLKTDRATSAKPARSFTGSLSAERAGKLSNKEIASQLDLTERAVEAHFYRTMKLLKEELRKFIMLFLSFYFLNNC